MQNVKNLQTKYFPEETRATLARLTFTREYFIGHKEHRSNCGWLQIVRVLRRQEGCAVGTKRGLLKKKGRLERMRKL